jgi:hypothetical protein
MTNDLEISPNLSENEEQNNNDEELSELSLFSSPEINQEEQEEIKNDELPSELHDQINEVLHLNENKEENDLTQFIKKAQQQGFNCLDLSKKNIIEFPSTLLAFPSLQVKFIYSINKKKKKTFFLLVFIFRR